MNHLDTFFRPKTVAVVGVSKKKSKVSSVVFQNIIESGYSKKLYAINPKYAGKKLYNKNCYKSLAEIKESIDLVAIVVPSEYVESVIDDCVKNKTKNIIIISSGFSEIGELEKEKIIASKCKAHGINLLGPNCLGAIFPHQNLNVSFSDGQPKKGNLAFISQSGAFCTAILDWANQKNIGFSHFISLGNKADLSEIDFLESLADDSKVEMFALYLESQKDGHRILKLICRISGKKPVIILEPGKFKNAQRAAQSHTGNLAPDYRVLQSAFQYSGAIHVQSMREMFQGIEILTFSKNKNLGSRVCIVTNAGGIGVLSTDLIEENSLQLSALSSEKKQKLRAILPAEANVHNPVDLVGDAPAIRYQKALEILLDEDGVDQILVLLTPQSTTEVDKTAKLLSTLSKKTNKNIVASFIGGEQVVSGRKILEKNKIPSFEFPADAIITMGLIANYKNQIECSPEDKFLSIPNPEIETMINEAKSKELKSLPHSSVRRLLEIYNLDIPLSSTFIDKEKARQFIKTLFPHKAVMKLVAPDVLHRTEMDGVFLDVVALDKLIVLVVLIMSYLAY